MSQVATVGGPVEVADLGPTYMHEHIFNFTTEIQQNYPAEWGSEEERVADAVAQLRALTAQGVRTIVDLTVVGLGRYLPRIQRVADQVPDLNIIVATGVYTFDNVPLFFALRGPAARALAAMPDAHLDGELTALLRDPAANVRGVAAGTLLARSETTGNPLPVARGHLEAMAAMYPGTRDWQLVARLGEAARPALELASKDEVPGVREEASRVLARLHSAGSEVARRDRYN